MNKMVLECSTVFRNKCSPTILQNKWQRVYEIGQKAARISVILFCIAGFVYQSVEFLNLYWTYPTVVDIQQSSPASLDIPAITVCNPIGYNFTAMCTEFLQPVCIRPFIFRRFFAKFFCDLHPKACIDDQLPQDMTGMLFNRFLSGVESISYQEHDKLRLALEDYMSCNIEFDGKTTNCNLQNVMGSFYTRDAMPQYCFTIYSLWGQPDKQRERIQKGATMHLHFSLNASSRSEVAPNWLQWGPKHNTPTSPYVQVAVHSPYFLPSPYSEGHTYQGGKKYQMRITMDEKHLLPFPYRTNCTDYLTEWKRNGGRGPVNQLGVIQECRMRRWYESVGCVPLFIDYPHTYSICGTETAKKNAEFVNEDKCILLADHYNQPCDHLSYDSTKEEVDIVVIRSLVLENYTEELETKIPFHDCSSIRVWRPECSLIDIDILFDRFEITELKYNPKFEQLELFSAIGGYMGMWLGVSLVVIYDYIGAALGHVKTWALKWHKSNKVLQPEVPEEDIQSIHAS